MDIQDNRYSKVEGMLYSYPKLPYEIKNLEIELKMIENEYMGIKGSSGGERGSGTNLVSSSVENEVFMKEKKLMEIRKKINNKHFLIERIDNALECLKLDDEVAALLIRLRYIQKLEWNQIASQLHMDDKSLMRKRNEIIKELIPMLTSP